MKPNHELIAFVYSILVRNTLNDEQIEQVIIGKQVPADFCDDNMLMAQAFVDLEYIKDIEDEFELLNTDDYNNAWNGAYNIALSNKLFPWEFECYWSKDAFITEQTTVETVKFFGTGNGYTAKEYELLYKLSIGETMQSPDYGHYHTVKRLK